MRITLDRSYRRTLVVPMCLYGPERRDSWEMLAAIDTGASGVMIPTDVARFLGYAVDLAETERIIAGNSVFDAPKIVVSRVDVEGARATEVDGICHELPEECPVDALVGLSFLTRFNIAFDFDAWEMELAPRA